MILCGPFGQAGYALQVLGSIVKKSFPAYGQGTLLTEEDAVPISAVSQFAAVLCWGFVILWWMFAIISIVHTVVTQPGGIRKTTFSMGAWSLVFPWVGAKGLLQLYEQRVNWLRVYMQTVPWRSGKPWTRRLSRCGQQRSS